MNKLQYLLVFLVGFFSDIIIHLLGHYKVCCTSLSPYYNSLSSKKFVSYFLGAILGGLACLFALFVADIIMAFIK